MGTLTAKQERYAQLRAIHGLNETDAYLLSYNVTTKLKETIWPAASKLEHNYKVATRLAQLAAERQKAIVKAEIKADIADRVEREKDATLVMRAGDVSYADRLKANRLLGEYEKELGSATTIVAPQNITLNQLSVVINEATPDQTRAMLQAMERFGTDRVMEAFGAFLESQERAECL